MKKRIVEVAVARVEIGIGVEPQVNDRGFLRFTIQSTGGGVDVGRKLFVFDHRPAVLRVVKKVIDPKALWEDRRKAEDTLVKTIRQPAKVVVMEKTDKKKTFYYVNLYPVNGQKQKLTALFSKTSYISKHNAGFEVKEDNAFWSFTSESSSRTGRHQEMVLVALTDDDHKVIVDSYGYANIGHSDKNLTVVGSKIRQMAEEELAVLKP